MNIRLPFRGASFLRFFRVIFTSPACKIFIASLLLYGIAFEYCHVHYWRDPHSAFFDDTHVYDLKYSLARKHEALQYIYIHNAEIEPPHDTIVTSRPLMCAAFITVKKDGANYFDASVGSLLTGLDPRERRALLVNVFFANMNASQHPSWRQHWIEQLLDGTYSYNVSQEVLEKLQSLEEGHNFHEKGVL